MNHRKPDMRDQAKNKVAPTDNHAIRPGSVEKPDNIRAPRSDMHATAPDVGNHLAEGQVTKSN